MNKIQLSKIVQILDENEFGVVATNSISNKSPESAVVAISHTPDLKLIFGTFKQSRKYTNIISNPHLSVVIGWDNNKKQTMQIEGIAELVALEKRTEIENIHCAKNPSSEKFRNNLNQQYFLITPKWIRYSNFSTNPQEIWELEL